MSGLCQDQIDFSYTALAWMENVGLVLYAPFAKTWKRALVTQFALASAWSVTRMVADIQFDEDAGPGIVYVVIPLESVMLAAIARTLKLSLFRIPTLKRFEQRVRSPFARARRRTS